jgi:SAM-dependent methyltransferase
MHNSNGCRFCASEKHEKCFELSDIFGDKYSIQYCQVCSAYFLYPPPTKEQLARAYDDSYYGKGDEKFSSSLFENILDIFRKKRAKKTAKSLQSGAKVLDIGCGNGKYLDFVSKYGDFQLFGIEMPGNSAKRAAKIPNMQLHIGKIESANFPEDYFDAISLFHVFEHLEEPLKTIEIISKIAKKNARFQISFPNIDSFQAKRFKADWLHLDPPRHLLYFKPKDFIKLMKKHGFELVKESYFSIEQNPFGMVQSILNRHSKKRDMLFESMKGNTNYLSDVKASQLFLHKAFFYCGFPLFIICDFFASMLKKSATVDFVFYKKSS